MQFYTLNRSKLECISQSVTALICHYNSQNKDVALMKRLGLPIKVAKTAQGAWHAKFVAYFVILCNEKQRPKHKYCCSPKGKHFFTPYILAPPKIWAGYAIVIAFSLFKFR